MTLYLSFQGESRGFESHPFTVVSVSPQGGTQQLSERLAERVGLEDIRLGSAVTAIWQVRLGDVSLRD